MQKGRERSLLAKKRKYQYLGFLMGALEKMALKSSFNLSGAVISLFLYHLALRIALSPR